MRKRVRTAADWRDWGPGSEPAALTRGCCAARPLGQGAYGIVVGADDRETGKTVAIKKVPDIAGDVSTAQRILRELKLLRCAWRLELPQRRAASSNAFRDVQPLPGSRKHHWDRQRDDGAAAHA